MKVYPLAHHEVGDGIPVEIRVVYKNWSVDTVTKVEKIIPNQSQFARFLLNTGPCLSS